MKKAKLKTSKTSEAKYLKEFERRVDVIGKELVLLRQFVQDHGDQLVIKTDTDGTFDIKIYEATVYRKRLRP